jgi:hypothetical protein
MFLIWSLMVTATCFFDSINVLRRLLASTLEVLGQGVVLFVSVWPSPPVYKPGTMPPGKPYRVSPVLIVPRLVPIPSPCFPRAHRPQATCC